MAFNNVVDTITLEDIVPNVVDTVLRTNRFAVKMLSKTKRFRAATQDCTITNGSGDNIALIAIAISEVTQVQAPRSMHQYRLRRAP